MLPAPTFIFTIPSIYDDTVLSARIHHPDVFHASTSSTAQKWQPKGAIVAHPYAPLGGCMDDPVVSLVANELLKAGFVVGLFEFRGAGNSNGRTSWSALPEDADYSSFVGFFVHYLHLLQPFDSTQSPSTAVETTDNITLLLSGYSYGALITTHLPPVDAILKEFETPLEGTAAAEIRLRASNLSSEWNRARKKDDDHAEEDQHGRTLRPIDAQRRPSSSRSRVVGGDESDPGHRKHSKESKRGLEHARKEATHKRLLPKSKEPTIQGVLLPAARVNVSKTYYLLISPLVPPISVLGTMFSRSTIFRKMPLNWFFRHKESSSNPSCRSRSETDNYHQLTTFPTLAVFGDKDVFNSHSRLLRWADDLSKDGATKFQFVDVQGAGHFWHQEAPSAILKEIVNDWMDELALIE